MNKATQDTIQLAADFAGISTSTLDTGMYPTLGQLLTFHKVLQAGGDIPTAPAREHSVHGLFEGMLDSLQLQKRHTDRVVELMHTSARKFDRSSAQRKHLEQCTADAMDQLYEHSKSCTEFFATFGDRLTLKDTP